MGPLNQKIQFFLFWRNFPEYFVIFLPHIFSVVPPETCFGCEPCKGLLIFLPSVFHLLMARFSSKDFTVVALIFRSLIHFGLLFVYGVR